MLNIFLIGGSPSSGSTLLVNLLNQDNKAICLPETGLFSHGRNLLEPRIESDDEDLSLHLPWLLSTVKASQSLGWEINDLQKLENEHRTAFDVIRARIDPKQDYWLIEKTPENVFSFYRYLADNKENRVIVTSRDAQSVIRSLIRRGFNLLEAMIIWFSHSYETARLIEDFPSQVFHCRYEQLTKRPKKIERSIKGFLGIEAFWGLSERYPQKQVDSGKTEELEVSDDFPPEKIQSLFEAASWKLEDTVWTLSPSANVEFREPVQMLGLAYEMMVDSIVFRPPSGTPMTIRKLDAILRTGKGTICASNESDVLHPVKGQLHSLFTQTLSNHYQPCLRPKNFTGSSEFSKDQLHRQAGGAAKSTRLQTV